MSKITESFQSVKNDIMVNEETLGTKRPRLNSLGFEQGTEILAVENSSVRGGLAGPVSLYPLGAAFQQIGKHRRAVHHAVGLIDRGEHPVRENLERPHQIGRRGRLIVRDDQGVR